MAAYPQLHNGSARYLGDADLDARPRHGFWSGRGGGGAWLSHGEGSVVAIVAVGKGLGCSDVLALHLPVDMDG
jgi:hypothetical protein